MSVFQTVQRHLVLENLHSSSYTLFLRWLQQIAFQVWSSYKNVGQ